MEKARCPHHLRRQVEDSDGGNSQLLPFPTILDSVLPSSQVRRSGIRHGVDAAIPCFLASIYSALPLIERLLPTQIHGSDTAMQERVETWDPLGTMELPPSEIRGIQAAWEEPQNQAILAHLKNWASTPEDQARLLAVREPNTGAWLNVVPSPQLGTLLHDEAFCVATAFRFGCDKCPCGAQVTSKGYHDLSCRSSAGRQSRHAAVNEVIARALRSAEIPCTKEPPGCSRADGKRPDVLTLIPWARGRAVVWDFF